MSLFQKIRSLLGHPAEPVGTVRISDRSPLNWLYITYNTVEELVRTNPAGITVSAAMKSYRWTDDHTLDVTLRSGNRFPGGEPLTAATVKKAFDEMRRWAAPHPPARSSTTPPGPRANRPANSPSASGSPRSMGRRSASSARCT